MPRTIRLEHIGVPHACATPWESMSGSAQTRTCTLCAREVHDLSDLTRAEAEALLNRDDERLCVRISRDIDGEIITADRRPITERPRRVARLSLATFVAF